jgi:hypothetical protein
VNLDDPVTARCVAALRVARAAQSDRNEWERRDDIRLCEMLLWTPVQGPRRGQQPPLSGGRAETLRRVRDGGQWRLPSPQGAGEVLRLRAGGARRPGREVVFRDSSAWRRRPSGS